MKNHEIVTNTSAASPELICDHCQRTVPMTFEVITGQACGTCAQALEFSEIVDELTSMYEFIYSDAVTPAPPV